LAAVALGLHLFRDSLTGLLPAAPAPGMARILAGNILGGWFDRPAISLLNFPQ
jgi:hypothetical protein